jgi:hypothetical protein
MTLQPHVVAHRGEGITDPELQATFDDPVHLTIPPDSWEEKQRQEEERKSRRSHVTAKVLALRIYNCNSNNADQQWSQGADGPTLNNIMFSVNPIQHFMQVQPHILAFLQQQMYGQQQLPHQQQQQLYTTENDQQLIMRQDSSNNNNRDGL